MTEQEVRNIINQRDSGSFFTKLWFICGLGWMFDAMDISALGLVLPLVSEDFGLTRSQSGLLSSLTFVGFMVGAVLTGVLSDRYGRRTLMMTNIVIFSVGTFLCGFATNYEWLLAARLLAGLGLGGEFPIISAYLTELSPKHMTGKLIGLTSSFFAYGFALSPLIALYVIPILGWRGYFWVLLFPVLLVIWIRRSLPESPLFLARKGRHQEAKEAVERIIKGSQPLETTLEKHVDNSGHPFSLWRTIYLCAIFFLTFLSQYGFLTWVPSVIKEQVPALGNTYWLTAIIATGMIVGYLSAAIFGRYLNIRTFLILAFLEFGIFIILFGSATSVVSMVIFGWFAAAGYGFTTISAYTYTPLQFETSFRGRGVGIVTGVGRIGAIIGPWIVGVLSPTGSFALSFLFFGVGSIIVSLLVIIVDRNKNIARLENRGPAL